MGKENDSESPKKRRKSINSGSGTPVKDNDMYKTIITFEEQEATSRPPDEDSERFFSTCDIIRRSMEKISKLKSTDDTTSKDDIRELVIDTSLAFMELKKLNRMEKFRTKFARDALASAKMGVDSRHLQLQNLLYEVMHLKKEVIKCLQFKSKDELIELVPEDEFYAEAPESVARPEITKEDPHQLRLARLEWELTQRKQLSSLCDELTAQKKTVASSISTKQSRLDNLAPQLRQILESSKPLQESLGLPLDKIRSEHQKASLLPSPLYVLYMKSIAYRDACDAQLIVNVEGDEDEAKRINNQERGEDSDSDQEMQNENLPEEAVHKKRHHRLSKEARIEEKKTRILQKHPLTVQLIIAVKNDTKISLTFSYMTLLKIITVDSHLEAGTATGGNLLEAESVLKELYPGDHGTESPNPANEYQLKRQNLGNFGSLNVGTPYRWAQRMAGLHFAPSEFNSPRVDKKVAHDSVEEVLKEVKKRVKARIELCTEIKLLESGNFPIFMGGDPMPQKVATNLIKFQAVKRMEEENSGDVYFEAILRRGSSEITAKIIVKPDYPKVSPIFQLKMNEIVQADVLRDIEREVNVMWDKTPTLAAQIQRLRACFDVYLETESLAPKEKVFFYPVRGRTRARPYKFLPLGGGIFKQR